MRPDDEGVEAGGGARAGRGAGVADGVAHGAADVQNRVPGLHAAVRAGAGATRLRSYQSSGLFVICVCRFMVLNTIIMLPKDLDTYPVFC